MNTLKDTNNISVAVVGATGMVGRKVIEVLEQYKINIANLYPFASAKSAGKKIAFNGKECTVIELSQKNIESHKIDYAIFSAGGSISKEFAPIFARQGCVAIDNSSQWRMDKLVPLVVPEVNPDALKTHNNIIANPNCSTIQAVVALSPLHKKFGIKRIVYSSYQAVSGAGVEGVADLERGIKGEKNQKFSRQIFSNILPQIDVFMADGYTKEEQKMIAETKKILGDDSLKITATTVRVPVFNCHSISVNIEFKKSITLEAVKEALNSAKGVVVLDDPSQNIFPTVLDADGKDEVFVGRLRLDNSAKNALNMWIVADNIRKGAATNTVQILKHLIES